MFSSKPKLGIILASHTREPSGFSLDLLNRGIEAFKKVNIEVYFNNKYLNTDKEIRDELTNLKKYDVDAYLVLPGNWIEPPVLCHPLEEIRNENILLLGFPESLELIKKGHFLGSNSAFTVLRNAMNQMGFRFKAIQKFPDKKDCIKEIYNFVRAAAVVKDLRRTKLGLIGYCSMGIYTACFDQLKIRKVFGTEIDTSADSYILYMQMLEVCEEEINNIINKLSKKCIINEEIVRNGSLEKSIRMYIALKKMITEGNWAGLTVKCQHEFSTYLRCTACLPLSLLTDEGIMCTDEGDIHSLLTMTVFQKLSEGNDAIYFGDIYKLEEGGFLMDHCGLSPHSCAKPDEKVSLLPQNPRISKDGKTTGGVISSYAFKEGSVTIGRIENDVSGNYFFHFCKGYVKPTDSVAYGWSTLIFTPNEDNEFFADNQLANHYIFIYGNIESKLQEFCSLLSLKSINR